MGWKEYLAENYPVTPEEEAKRRSEWLNLTPLEQMEHLSLSWDSDEWKTEGPKLERLREEAQRALYNAPRLKAREEVLRAREGLAEARANLERVTAQAKANILEWEKILSIADINLERVDPAIRALRITKPLPRVGTQPRDILILCRTPHTAHEVSDKLSLPLAQANAILSNLYRSDFVTKPERGVYHTRRAVLVAMGILDNIKDDDLVENGAIDAPPRNVT